ncbi:MAG TPA: universal stress protein [Trebonia sp.]|nr:universal stress protein [Trebonia sp.]
MTFEPSRAGGHLIIAGVDGSPASKAALAWAVRQAQLTGAGVEAVIAWQFPPTYGYPVTVAPAADWEKISAEVVDDAIAGVPVPADVPVTRTVVEGNAARVLLDAAKNADLLVVGNRGHGGFVEALLGSVSQHCVHHADCPVVVVRAPDTGPGF